MSVELINEEPVALQPSEIRFSSRTSGFHQLSNFAPHGFTDEDGMEWPNVESYYQAQKLPDEEHAGYRELIRTCGSPSKAKRYGQERPAREDWDTVREGIMLYAVSQKFKDPELQALLLSTGEAKLIEDVPGDSYWGIGDGSGQNRLGEILMEIRQSLKEKA